MFKLELNLQLVPDVIYLRNYFLIYNTWKMLTLLYSTLKRSVLNSFLRLRQ